VIATADWTAWTCRVRVAVTDPDALDEARELVTALIDEWGHPLLAAGELPPGLVRAAKKVAAACPTRALRLRDDVRPR
jgi:ferredoxin